MQHEVHFVFFWIVYWEITTGADQIGLFLSRYFKYTLGLLMVIYLKSKPDHKKKTFHSTFGHIVQLFGSLCRVLTEASVTAEE